MNVNYKYLPFIKRTLDRKGVRYVIITGGRGSGKTFILDRIIAQRIMMSQNDTILYTRYTLAGLRNGTLPEWRRLNHDYPEIYLTNTAAMYGDSRIIFDGIKSASPSKLKSIAGCTVFICDEAADIMKEEEFDTIEQSVRTKGGDNLVILCLNPTTPDHWIYKRFYVDKTFEQIEFNGATYTIEKIVNENVLHIHTTFLDNLTNLSDSFLEIAKEAQKSNEKRFLNQFIGAWVDYDGTKIFNWKLSEDIDRSLPVAVGVDFGYYPDPTAICKVYCDNVGKKLYVEGVCYQHKMTAEELKEEILKYSNYRIVADLNVKPVTEPLRLQGLDIYYKNMKVELKQQLIMLSQYEIITDDSYLRNELMTYRWGKAGEALVGYGDHAIDALRYAAFNLIRE